MNKANNSSDTFSKTDKFNTHAKEDKKCGVFLKFVVISAFWNKYERHFPNNQANDALKIIFIEKKKEN